jgi:hypothetical protein
MIAVAYGTSYDITFDAKWTSGETNLRLTLAEYAPGNSFQGQAASDISISNASWTGYSTLNWTPSSASTTLLSLIFTPALTTGGNMSVGLDNVQVTAVPEPGAVGLLVLGMAGLLTHRFRQSKQRQEA